MKKIITLLLCTTFSGIAFADLEFQELNQKQLHNADKCPFIIKDKNNKIIMSLLGDSNGFTEAIVKLDDKVQTLKLKPWSEDKVLSRERFSVNNRDFQVHISHNSDKTSIDDSEKSKIVTGEGFLSTIYRSYPITTYNKCKVKDAN